MVCSFFLPRKPNGPKGFGSHQLLQPTGKGTCEDYADICKGTVEIPAFSSLLKIKDEGSVASLC